MNEGILSGITVLELASVLAGPSVGMFFAELGARVIKVENLRTKGDVTRTWRLKNESTASDRSAYFSAVNWGKASIAIDLGTPEGQQIVFSMVEKADIVLLSYKPGDAEKFHLHAESLLAINPRLIHASLSAYGPDDPRPGFDAIIQAEAGFTYMNGTPDSGPVKMPVALMDLLAAHQLKEACLLALYQREKTGKGAAISASLIASGLASLANQATNYLIAGQVPQRMGSEHPNIVPYGTIYPSADGHSIVLAVGSDVQFRQLCDVLGLPELAQDPDFSTNMGRVRHREALNAELSARILEFDRDDLLDQLEDANVPAGAVRDMADVMRQPYAAEMLLKAEGLSGIRGVAFDFEGVEKIDLAAPPKLNQHAAALLQEFCGWDLARIEEFRMKGIIGHGGTGN